MERIAIFNFQCPNCGGPISNDRLEIYAPCEKCSGIPTKDLEVLYKTLPREEYLKTIVKLLEERGKLKNYKKLYELELKVKEFEDFFRKAVGSKPWSAQRTWFIRVLKKESFSITAPTGMGKTTWGSVMAIYLAREGKKCYIVLPTKVLVKQVYEKIQKYLENLGIIDIEVLAYLKSSQKLKKQIQEGKFDILITSNQFLARNFDILKDKHFGFVFVDDVDALLKASKNIDRTLQLIGFKEEHINLAWEIIKLKLQVAKTRDQKKVEELANKIKELKDKLEEEKKKLYLGVLVLSSATGKARGLRVRLYRELLNFEIGTSKISIRNIIDVYKYPEKDIKEEVLDLVKKLEDGILIFVTTDQGKDFAIELSDYLKNHGIKAEAAIAGKTEVIEKFAKGELNVLVGVAHYYGTIVRGLDLPHRVKYAIFTGVPRFRFNAKVEETDPRRILLLLRTLLDFLPEEYKEEAEKVFKKLADNLKKTSPAAITEVKKAIEENRKLEGFLGYLQELTLKARDICKKALSDERVIKKIEEYPYLALERKDDTLYILIPDVKTYIQASGRTSRLYAGGVTKGLSIILVDNEKLLKGLMQALKWIEY